jgi:RHS repeat-associated protein
MNYYAQGRPGAITDEAGQITTLTYTNEGQVATIRRNHGGQEETIKQLYYTFGADTGSAGRLKEVHGPGDLLLASFTYDAVGTDSEGYTVRYDYDVLDRLLRVQFPDGTFQQTIYNRLDPEWECDREGRWTHMEHNALRKVSAVTDPLGRTTQFQWCPCGALEAIIDAKDQQTTFSYDVQSRVTQKHYADASVTSYGYEPASGRLKSMTDARGQRTNYEYFVDNTVKKVLYTNAQGAPLQQTLIGGTKINASVEYTYDPVYSRLTTITDSTGVTTYAYHPTNGAPAALGAGRLASVQGPLAASTITYSYDEYGRLVKRQINGVLNTITRVYDSLGRLNSETNPLGKFAYAYLANTGRLASVEREATEDNESTSKTTYEYWPALVATPGSGDGDRRLKAICHYRDNTVLAATFAYAYKPAGNIIRWTQWHEGLSNPLRYDLNYDAADQLVGAIKKDAVADLGQERSVWRYDAAANREIEQISVPQPDGGYATSLTKANYNNLNQLNSRTGGSGMVDVEGTVDKLATVTINGQAPKAFFRLAENLYGFSGEGNPAANPNPAKSNTLTITAIDASGNPAQRDISITLAGTAIPTLSYDNAGNLLSDGTRTYLWDAANRLVQITYPGTGNRTEFTYDGLGRRVRIREYINNIISDDRGFLWDALSIGERRDASTNVVKRRYYNHGWAAGVSSLPTATERNLYRRDHLGSIREVVNDSVGLVLRQDFDLWGRRSTSFVSGADEWTDFAYTGHYYHSATKLHLALYRAYSAETARWLSRDPLQEEAGLNMYSLCDNAPVSRTDPLGLFDISDLFDPYHQEQVAKKLVELLNPLPATEEVFEEAANFFWLGGCYSYCSAGYLKNRGAAHAEVNLISNLVPISDRNSNVRVENWLNMIRQSRLNKASNLFWLCIVECQEECPYSASPKSKSESE